MLESSNQKIVVICGPTGIGKTELSLSLAGAFHGSIVSADSMQIYRYMNIGTAKSSPEEMDRIPHYMINVVNPDDSFDAVVFYKKGHQALNEIFDLKRVPFVVGGTGFYIKALLHGLFEAKPVDPEVIKKLKYDADADGIQSIYDRLAVCDPEAAARIHPNDAYRVIRALAVFEMTGKPMTEFQQAHGFKETPFDVLKICLSLERDALYERINRRVDRMVAEGLLDEVKNLLERGFGENLRPMQAIGYRHMVDYIKGHSDWDETIFTLKRDTRRYAKRQLTWFRKDKEMIWKAPEDVDDIKASVRKFLG